MQLFAGELTNQNREYYKVNDNKDISLKTNLHIKLTFFVVSAFPQTLCLQGFQSNSFFKFLLVPNLLLLGRKKAPTGN